MRRIDRYVVLEPVVDRGDDEGPCISRHAAYDTELERRVELAVLHVVEGSEAHGSVAARLQALARLEHHNLSTVLTVGSAEGEPFAAFAWHDAPSLPAWIRDAQPEPRDIARVLAFAGRGLAAAHRAAVAHGRLTAERIRIGEQARTIVDGFGLGIDASGVPTEGSVRDDCDRFCALVEGALTVRPRRVQRLLSRWRVRGEPVPIADLVAALWPRRTRPIVYAAAVVAVAGLGIGVASGRSDRPCTEAARHLDGVWDEARRDEVANVFASSSQVYAEDTAASVLRTLDGWSDAWVRHHTEACESTRVDRSQSEAVLELRLRCLDRRRDALRTTIDVLTTSEEDVVDNAVRMVQKLPRPERCMRAPAELSDAMTGGDDAVVAQSTEAKIRRDAGQYDHALAIVNEAVEAARDSGHEPTIADALLVQADLLERGGKMEDATDRTYEALWCAKRSGADLIVARAWNELLWVSGYRGADRAAAERLAGHASAAIERLGGDDELEGQRLDYLGHAYETTGDNAAAVTTFERALALAERVYGTDHPKVVSALNGLAMSLKNQTRYTEAAPLFGRALALVEGEYGPHHPNVATVLANIGNLRRAQGRYDEAEAAHARALQIRLQAQGEAHPDVAAAYHNLGSLHVDRGRYDEGARFFERAATSFEAALGPEHPHVGTARTGLGYVMHLQGHDEQALAQFELALRILENALGDEHPALGSTRTNMGLALHALGRLDEAAEQHRSALDVFERIDHPHQINALINLGEVHRAREDFDAAIEVLQRALQLADEAGAAYAGIAAAVLGGTLLEVGRLPEALEHLRRAETQLEALESDPIRLADVRLDLAEASWRTGRRDEAIEDAQAAARTFREADVQPDRAIAWLKSHGHEAGTDDERSAAQRGPTTAR